MSDRGISDFVRTNNASLSVSSGGGSKKLLDRINICVRSASFTVIIGPSGCGKSTLLNILAGNRALTEGEVYVAGSPVEQLRKNYPLAIGFIAQFPAFHERLTVRETLEFAAQLRLPPTVEEVKRSAWLRHIGELAGLGNLLEQPLATLSGGQQRRLALAEELMGDPPVLFLDELTSGLDPQADMEIMEWLADLAHRTEKTVVLVTHTLTHIDKADDVIFLNAGTVGYQGPVANLLPAMGVSSIEALYQLPASAASPNVRREGRDTEVPTRIALRTERPPNAWRQLMPLLRRLTVLLRRDPAQLALHASLIISFPLLVVVFALSGLPQVRQLSLTLESNVLRSLQEQLFYLSESLSTASLVSGLAMFQVILLVLMGSNNGAREIARERALLQKELRLGLSPWAYLFTKLAFCGLLSFLQAFWMTFFVRVICRFPGNGTDQFVILFLVTLAMSFTCLAISANVRSAEKASLLAIYFVGLQLPLSGAVLALPEALSWVTRPVIAAYWGWSGYLQSMVDSPHYDVVRQATDTFIAPFYLCVLVLIGHSFISVLIARRGIEKLR